jgi:pimeloyl-ACP methyl ester carboxylesterase
MFKKIFLEIKGQRVAITVGGEGKPFLMLHGWGGSKESWEPLMEKLEVEGFWQKNLAIAVDFPGFGESDEPAKAWNVGDYAHFTEDIIGAIYREMNLSGDYNLMVHSFGGRVALKMLSLDFVTGVSEKVDKLILVAAAGVKPSRTLRIKVAAAAARLGKKIMLLPGLRMGAPLAQKILYKVLKTHDYEKSSGVMRETFLKVIDEDLSDSLAHIKNPTLIIWGKLDSYVPFSDALLMERKILGSKLIAISDGRHGIHKTHAGDLAKWIKEFLTDSK